MGVLRLGAAALIGCCFRGVVVAMEALPLPTPTRPSTAGSASRMANLPMPTGMPELKPRRLIEREHDLTTVFVAPDSICGYNMGSPGEFWPLYPQQHRNHEKEI
jgi:hypothetical protein